MNLDKEILISKFEPYLNHQVFIEVLDLVRQNSKGKIWIMGGFLYRNLAAALYGGGIYDYDIDFLVAERNEILKDVPHWKIELNNYGSQNYVRDGHKMSFTDIRKAIRMSGIRNPTVEQFIQETPFTIQSIAYDLEEKQIVGKIGVEALLKRTVGVNDRNQAEFYAKKKGRPLEEILAEKARELGFRALQSSG